MSLQSHQSKVVYQYFPWVNEKIGKAKIKAKPEVFVSVVSIVNFHAHISLEKVSVIGISHLNKHLVSL